MKLMLTLAVLVSFIYSLPIQAQQSKNIIPELEQFISNGNWAEAIDLANLELQQLRSDSSKHALYFADIHYHIGRAYYNQGNFEPALSHIHSSLIVNEAENRSLHAADCINLQADIAWYTVGIQKALEGYNRAIEIYNTHPDKTHPGSGVLFEDRAYAYMELGQFSAARQDLNKALELNKTAYGDQHARVLGTYVALGNFNKKTNDLFQGLQMFQKARDIGEVIYESSTPNMGSVYASLGTAYFSIGDYYKAIDHFQRARHIFSAFLPADHPFTLEINGALCEAYSQLGQCREALPYCHHILTNAPPDDRSLVYVCQATGECHLENGQLDSAEMEIKRAISLARRQGGLEEIFDRMGRMYNVLTDLYSQQKDWEKAQSMLDSANYFFQPYLSENPMFKAEQDLITANLLEGQGHWDTARTYYPGILALTGYEPGNFKSVRHPQLFEMTMRNYSLNLLREYYESENLTSLQEGYSRMKILAQYFEYLLSEYISLETQLSFQNYSFDIYVLLLRAAANLYGISGEQVYLDEAYSFAEKSKNQRILEQWRLQLIRTDRRALDSLTFTRQAINYYEDKVEEQQTAGNPANTSPTLEVKDQLFHLKEREEFWQRQVQSQYKQHEQVPYINQPISLKAIQAQLSDQQSVLHYIVGQASIFLFLIKPDEASLVEIPHDFPLAEWTDSLRNAILLPFSETLGGSDAAYTELAGQYCRLAYQLYQKLLEPVSNRLSDQLIIIPDGTLGYIPFEVLLQEMPNANQVFRFKGHRYLIQDYSLSYAYSATLWQEMELKEQERTTQGSVLAIAPFAGPATGKPKRGEKTEGGLEPEFDNLPHSEAEVLALQELFGAEVLLNEAATVDEFLLKAVNFRILHLSTHAAVVEPNDHSFIAFYLQGSGNDPFLEVRELYNLELNADLVVLSACETALGKMHRGEGIISLARAFTYAGTKSIITTLWKVDDEPTQQIMVSFYQYLKQGLPKDAALAKAKTHYLQSAVPQYSHPYFWAGIIPIGDMQAITDK